MSSSTAPLAGPEHAGDTTTRADPAGFRASVEAVVAAASRAPSLHNTQPWQWRLRGGRLDLRADRTRQLHVGDPDGHSLLISCGAAAELTQLALAAQGWTAETSLLPEPADPDLLARFQLVALGRTRSTWPPAGHASRRPAAQRRRVFGPEPVSTRRDRAASDGGGRGPAVYAHFPVRRGGQSLDLAVAISRADRCERDEPRLRGGNGRMGPPRPERHRMASRPQPSPR